ncbi:uncharacterized protein LOC136038385 [Artemia franciscana]|uniref:uncharacterized protein LOC136038385 n=1 Tax=Artemia franciscana TaxID=6661 RepID=UPI0032DAAD05
MTSAVVKVNKRMFNSAASRHLEANNLLHSSQHCFCSGRSVDSYLLESYEHITKLLDVGVLVDMILLDFSKGLYKVCHKQLAIKLHAVKLEEKFLLWILDFLYMESQFVHLFYDW